MLNRGMIGFRPVGRVYHPTVHKPGAAAMPAGVRWFLIGATSAALLLLAVMCAAGVAFTVETVRMGVDALFAWFL